MARKTKDKKHGFAENTAFASAPNLPGLPPGMDLAQFIPPEPAGKYSAAEGEAEAAAAAQPKKQKAKQHYEGHRERLRQRYLAGGDAMPDYEYLELLLFRSLPRKDTKPLAKALLAHFGSLADVLSADIYRLQAVPGCGKSTATDLKIISGAAPRMLRTDLKRRHIFKSRDQVIAYCRIVMAYEQREQFRVLFLDKKSGLIEDKLMQVGTVDKTPVYPREVIIPALNLGASSVVLVHNHPSGDPTPSRQDVEMTALLQEGAYALGIAVHDHFIIGRNGYTSLRELNLLLKDSDLANKNKRR